MVYSPLFGRERHQHNLKEFMGHLPTSWARGVGQEEKQSSPKKDKTQGKWNLHPTGICCHVFWEKPFFSNHQASHALHERSPNFGEVHIFLVQCLLLITCVFQLLYCACSQQGQKPSSKKMG